MKFLSPGTFNYLFEFQIRELLLAIFTANSGMLLLVDDYSVYCCFLANLVWV